MLLHWLNIQTQFDRWTQCCVLFKRKRLVLVSFGESQLPVSFSWVTAWTIHFSTYLISTITRHHKWILNIDVVSSPQPFRRLGCMFERIFVWFACLSWNLLMPTYYLKLAMAQLTSHLARCFSVVLFERIRALHFAIMLDTTVISIFSFNQFRSVCRCFIKYYSSNLF